jgi:NAD-dependent SIR2 family protein deacetylase
MAIADRGGDLIEVNPYPSELTAMCRVTLTGPAGEVLPALVERVRALR